MPLELKNTLNLPKTGFPMKANLPQNEPKILDRWEQMKIYEQIRQARAGAGLWVLHDGPPYANGPIHLGHALNKCLKDFIVKSKTMAGFDSPYVPGWDCHGLPIEIKVDQQLGGKKLQMRPVDVRNACRKYAEKYLDLQRQQFKRIGVFGRFENPYSTMTPQYESVVLDTFYSFFEKEFVYKGLRAVYWCIHDKTALAEAEVEYENHTSPTVWVKYRLQSDPEKLIRRSRRQASRFSPSSGRRLRGHCLRPWRWRFIPRRNTSLSKPTTRSTWSPRNSPKSLRRNAVSRMPSRWPISPGRRWSIRGSITRFSLGKSARCWA